MAGPFLIYGGFILNPTIGQLVTLLPATTLKYVGLTTSGATGGPLVSAVATNFVGNSFNINFTVGVTIPILYYMAIGV